MALSVRGFAPARAALAGNPSDGYGGAVLAVTLAEWGAEVYVRPAAQTDIQPASELIAATLRRAAPGRALQVRWRSDIPREVGLAGSSAIVVATLRALATLERRAPDPVALAVEALAVEVEDLGIAAGPQDRLVQAHGGLLFMDFEGGGVRCERVDPGTLPPLAVAHLPQGAGPSHDVHGGLRARHSAGEPQVRAAMVMLGDLARAAHAGLLGGEVAPLRDAMDASLATRAEMLELDPRCLRAAERARRAGAAVNYAGSGGALVLACEDERHRGRVLAALDGEGWVLAAVNPG
jgi:galactokinase/mevalonate kinase-like predicted kinase